VTESPLVAASTPATPPPADTAKWIADQDVQWRAEYERAVTKPHEKDLAAVRAPYLAALDSAADKATRARHTNEAAALRAERDRIASSGAPLPAEDSSLPPTIKLARRSYQAQLTRVERERQDHARALFARCDDTLAKRQAESKAHLHPVDIDILQKERDQLRTDWLPAPVITDAAPPAKRTSRQILDKLRELGAEVAVKTEGGTVQEIQAEGAVVDGKFTFVRVNFRAERPDQTPLTAADYDILDALSEVQELGLSGPAVKDAVLEKLHSFRALHSLSLDRVRLSPAGYAALASLPALRELQLRDTNLNGDGLTAVAQCHKLQSLGLSAQPLKDADLADIGKLAELNSLQLSELQNLTSKGFVYIAQCRALKNIGAYSFVILSGMVENLAHCRSLESVSLPNTFLKDSEVASLSELPNLHSLDLSNSPVTGAVFGQWHTHKLFTSLNLDNAAGIDDAVCVHIEKVFPKLQDLYAKIAPSGFTKAGAETLGRLRDLRVLRLTGPGVNDEVLAELTHAATITTLQIPEAQLTDPGVASLSHLAHLTELNLDIPPITEAALKSFGHCKSLKTVNIGKDALPETEFKLQSAVPGLIVHRPEE
jgi:hypothetical protein